MADAGSDAVEKPAYFLVSNYCLDACHRGNVPDAVCKGLGLCGLVTAFLERAGRRRASAHLFCHQAA